MPSAKDCLTCRLTAKDAKRINKLCQGYQHRIYSRIQQRKHFGANPIQQSTETNTNRVKQIHFRMPISILIVSSVIVTLITAMKPFLF